MREFPEAQEQPPRPPTRLQVVRDLGLPLVTMMVLSAFFIAIAISLFTSRWPAAGLLALLQLKVARDDQEMATIAVWFCAVFAVELLALGLILWRFRRRHQASRGRLLTRRSRLFNRS